MKLIVGLGNPGKEYDNTRHNVGFIFVDKLTNDLKLKTEREDFSFNKNFQSDVLSCKLNSQKVILAKPQTYMNASGEAVKKMVDYYHFGSDDVLVISDDIDLPLGTIRTRLEGSSGGHKGLESVIGQIGSKFARIKIGIGPNEAKIPSEKYVLAKFTKDEEKILGPVLDETAKLVLEFIENGIDEKTIKIN